jgi:hypothetical protein
MSIIDCTIATGVNGSFEGDLVNESDLVNAERITVTPVAVGTLPATMCMLRLPTARIRNVDEPG